MRSPNWKYHACAPSEASFFGMAASAAMTEPSALESPDTLWQLSWRRVDKSLSCLPMTSVT
eukprot:2629865-Amphidinium_carterae.1